MGGIGSGRPAHEDRVTAESCRALDVNRLNRAGCLKPGWAGTWHWTQDGEQVASIRLRAEEGHVHLSYRYRFSGSRWLKIEGPVPLVWRPCRFGGQQPYFVCPGVVNGVPCRRRVVKLYGAEEYFLHCHCYGLSTLPRVRTASSGRCAEPTRSR